MENLNTNTSETLTQVTARINGRLYEVTTHKGGRTELYEEYADVPGMTRFLGHLEDLMPMLPATYYRDLAPLFQAHHDAHLRFWGSYLPGADRWLHS